MLHLARWRTRVAVLAQRADVSGVNAGTTMATSSATSSAGPQWNLNTFLRWSHYHPERHEEMRFDGDVGGSRWLAGDFAGHCSGLNPVRRALCIAGLLGAVMS